MGGFVRVGVGVDIGGTSTKFGLVTEAGEVLAKRSAPLDKALPFATFAADLGHEIAALLADGPAATAIGVGVPAYPNPETGGLMKPIPNVPPLAGGSLRDAFTARFGLPTVVGNDGVCAAEGEMVCGAGRPFQRFAVLTLGTGIGGAVVIDRKIIDGPHGLPPEIGAICLDPSRTDLPGPIPGTFEFLASASALLRRYQMLTGNFDIATARDVYERAKAGEPIALQVVHEGGRWIAQAIGMMSNMLNLEAVILGGGLSGAGDFLLDTVRPYLDGFYWAPFSRPPQLLLAQTGNDAGIIGAAAIGLAGSSVSGRDSLLI
jgi:glucokinase